MVAVASAILACLVMLAALWLARASMGRARAMSPLFVYVAGSVLFVNVGFVLYYVEHSTTRWAWYGLVVASLGVLFVSIGGTIATILTRVHTRWPQITQAHVSRDLPYSVAFLTGCATFAIVLLYFFLLGYVPLFSGIRTLISEGFVSGLTNTFRIKRDIYVNPDARYIPLQGFMEIVRYFALPIIATWFLHFYRLGIQRRVSLGMVVTSTTLVMLTGQRWPLMYMMATLLIYWSWSETNWHQYHRVFRRIMVGSILLGIVLSALLGRTLHGDLNLIQMLLFGLHDLAKRVLMGYVEIPFRSYALFAEGQGFLYGSSWLQNLQSYLPGPEPSFPVTFYQMVTGDQVGYTAAPDFYTEAFINFGWFGAFGLSVIWGFFLVLLQDWVMRAKGSLLRLGTAAVLVMMIGFSSVTGLTFLVSGLIVVFFVRGITFGLMLLMVPPKEDRTT